MSTSLIEHSGFISEISDSTVFVKIESASACSACHAKGMCSSSDKEEKIIEVERKSNQTYKIGQLVTIEMNQAIGTKAVLIGYFFPFLTVIIVFIIMMQLTENQGLVGIISLASLLPYYIIVSLFRNKHKKNFEFYIR